MKAVKSIHSIILLDLPKKISPCSLRVRSYMLQKKMTSPKDALTHAKSYRSLF